MISSVGRVACIVVTYDALPWVEQCLASVSGAPTAGRRQRLEATAPGKLVRERFPEVTLVPFDRIRGLAAGWNRGLLEVDAEFVLLLNADAWLVGEAPDALVATAAPRHPRAAVIAPRLVNPDGSLQRSVRGFPTVWRLTTEYLFLRKLAPRSRALNAFYGAGFDHDERARGRVGDGRLLPRATQRARRGRPVRRALLPLQRGGRLDATASTDAGWNDRCSRPTARVRPRRRRRARRAACSARTSAGTCATSSLHGRPGEAERARRLLRASLALRGPRCTAASAAACTARQPRWLGSGDVDDAARGMRPNTRR